MAPLSILPLFLVIVLAGVIGFTVHRANLCTVGAVKEILTTRRAFMLVSFVKTAMWVIGLTLIVAWALPDTMVQAAGWKLSLLSIGGGLLFGVGATINGGCAFSTLTRLGGGNLGMVISLAGFLFGAGVFGEIAANGLIPEPVETTAGLSRAGDWRLPVTVVLAVWMAWELVQVVRLANPAPWGDRLFAHRYRLSTAAAIMGLSNGVIFGLVGIWSYTRLLGQTTQHVASGAPPAPIFLWILFAALIGGVVMSACNCHRFHLRWRPQRAWLSYGMGGALMGFGAAMIPGGNDVLILHSIPSLSPHAVPAFVAMVAGIAITLLSMRALGQDIPRMDCGGDICAEPD